MFRKRNIDMLNGNIAGNMLMFALPIMVSDMLHMFYTAADTIIVGKFAGEIPLAAVGSTGSLCFLFVALFEGLSLGVNVVIARAIGEDDKDKVYRAVHTSAVICLAGGILLSVIAIIFSRSFLSLMSTPSSIIDLSTLYMRIYFGGIIFTLIFNFGSGALRAHGETRKPMIFQVIGGVLNIILNLIFVIIFKMSVAGVALATVMSQAAAAFLTVITLMNEDTSIRFYPEKMAYYHEETMEIVKVGLPAGITGIAFSLTNLIVQSSINSFDSSVIIAGNTAANNLENFVYIGIMGFESAVLTFSSQCYGARKYERIKKIFWTGMFMGVVSMGLIGLCCNIFNTPLLYLYTDNADVVEAGKLRLLYVSGFLFLNGIINIQTNSMRAVGYSSTPAIITLVGIIGVRVIWLSTFFPMHRALEVVYLCFPISWAITAIINGIALAIVHHRVLKV
ncbi:MAG: MATE family efflux transporter [Erysipelotrichaceae bacterium]|nr:MATE family efflux transporter [Erysipelotrichaceae bacterium]